MNVERIIKACEAYQRVKADPEFSEAWTTVLGQCEEDIIRALCTAMGEIVNYSASDTMLEKAWGSVHSTLLAGITRTIFTHVRKYRQTDGRFPEFIREEYMPECRGYHYIPFV